MASIARGNPVINFLSEVADFGSYDLHIEGVYLGTDFKTVRILRGCPTQEMILLRHLMDAGGWVKSEELMGALLDHRPDGGFQDPKILHVLMHRVRERLKDGYFIENRWGYGYRFVLDWEKFEQAAVRAAQEALAS